MVVKKEIQIGNKTLSFETGRFAKQADGAVMARYADTMATCDSCRADRIGGQP